MTSLWNREPALILGLVSACVTLVSAFGFKVSTEQLSAIMLVTSAVIAVITRQTVTSPESLQALTPENLAVAQGTADPVKAVVKKLPVVLLAAALLSGISCASLRRPNGSFNYPLLLTDMQYSLTEACSVEWLPPTVCVLGIDILTEAEALAAGNTHSAGVAARQSLVDAEAQLSAGSRLRPYLDVLIALLPSV